MSESSSSYDFEDEEGAGNDSEKADDRDPFGPAHSPLEESAMSSQENVFEKQSRDSFIDVGGNRSNDEDDNFEKLNESANS